MHEASREDLIRGIAENVQRIGLASERIGHLFADAQGLHTTDFRALTAIFRAERSGTPLTAKALAEHLQLSPAAITYVVERLVASGHVRRQQDEADRRRVILRFDEPGRLVAGAFFGPLAMAHLDALVSFDDQELAVASRVLGVLVTTLNGFGQSLE